jgi:predicted nicotinamide N-methyase
MQTRISDVGFQLWRASFFLSDFLLDNLNIIKDKTVIDLGSGLGITSFFASLFAKLVYCTDLEKFVKQAQANWVLNEQCLAEQSGNIFFKQIDWSNHESLFNLPTNGNNEFSLNENDIQNIKSATVFIAADVVYDNTITVKLMNIIYGLMVNGVKQRKVCYLANERRINFSTESYQVADTASDFFIECLKELDQYVDTNAGFKFKTEKIECDSIKNYITNYKRNKYLYLWKIECEPV